MIYISKTKYKMSNQQYLPKASLKNSILEQHESNNTNNFCELLKPYTNSEFLPTHIINKMLLYAFKSCEIMHEYTSYHKIIKIKISDLISAPIVNWQYNRPPDQTRCYDIARYIYRSKTAVDTMLYLSFNTKNQTFDIIDGIHRFTSIKIIENNNSKPLDLLTPSEFGNNEDAQWLYDSYIIINLRINASEGELIELFKSLNKSNPIPELYIRDVNKCKKDIIESMSNNWQVKYTCHFSSNNSPNKPNINRDRFIDLLEIIYDKYKITEETKSLLESKLELANTNISYNKPKKLTKKVIEKCTKSGCWLFVYNIQELAKMI